MTVLQALKFDPDARLIIQPRRPVISAPCLGSLSLADRQRVARAVGRGGDAPFRGLGVRLVPLNSFISRIIVWPRGS